MLFCRICSFQLIEGSKYCSKCGEPIVAPILPSQGQNSKGTKEKGQNKALIIIMTVIVTSAFNVAILGIIFLPGILAAKRNSNQRSVINTLRKLAIDQEIFRTDNTLFATIEKLALDNKIDVRAGVSGYFFTDLIKSPDADFFAVLASPKNWGKDGDCHYLITSDGIVREYRKMELPFGLILPPTQNSINITNKLNEAH
jgi:hypothetical protein